MKTMNVTEFRKKQKTTLDKMKHNEKLHLLRDSQVVAVVIRKVEKNENKHSINI